MDQRRVTPDGRAPGGEQHAGENLDPGFWPNLDPDPVPDPDPGLYSIPTSRKSEGVFFVNCGLPHRHSALFYTTFERCVSQEELLKILDQSDQK